MIINNCVEKKEEKKVEAHIKTQLTVRWLCEDTRGLRIAECQINITLTHLITSTHEKDGYYVPSVQVSRETPETNPHPRASTTTGSFGKPPRRKKTQGIYIYIASPNPSQHVTIRWLRCRRSPANARFGDVLSLCSLLFSRCSPLLPHCYPVLPLNYFLLFNCCCVFTNLNENVPSVCFGCWSERSRLWLYRPPTMLSSALILLLFSSCSLPSILIVCLLQ